MSPITISRYAFKLVSWATPHVQRVVRSYSANANEAERHFERKNFAEAAKYYSANLKEANARHYPARKKLQILLRLAESLRRSGNLDKALALGKDALAQASAMGEKDAFHTAALEALSMTHEDRGEKGEALALARKALAAAEGEDKPASLAAKTGRLAKLEREAGNLAEAKRLMLASIDHYRKAHGADHPGTAAQLSSMAQMLQEEGQLGEALLMYRKAYGIHKEALGGSARETQSDLEHIGQLEYLSHNLAGAMKSYDLVARMKENEIGGNTAEHARFLVDAATVHEAAGEMGKALEFLMQANQKAGRDAELAPIVTERIARLRQYL